MTELTFRTAEPTDIDTIVELVTSAYRGEASTEGWTTEHELLGGQRTDAPMVADAIDDTDGAVILAERSDAVVGCIQVTREGERAHFGLFAVDPTAQARGIGSELIDEAERTAREWGCTSMDIEVIAQRAELLAYYERRGYRPTGETTPFPYGDERFGIPRRDDLYFVVLARSL